MFNKILRIYLKRAELHPLKTHKKKTAFAENVAILRKRKLYKEIKWSTEQKEEFNSFCKSVYGKRISPRWHKLYQSINGTFDVSYVPEKIFSTIIELNANDYSRCKVLQDKNLLPYLLSSKAKTPATLVFNSYGKYYNEKGEIISKKEAIALISNCGMAVLKPSIDSSSGKNILFLDLEDGVDKNSGAFIEAIFNKYDKNFILQKKLIQCKESNDIYPEAINTFRITTYVLDDGIYTLPCAMRFGSGGNHLDNIHAGGFSIAISDDGVLWRYAYKLGRCDRKDKIQVHPDTGLVFDGYRIPNFNKVLQTAKDAHSCFSGVGFISWDIILNAEYEPVIVEANILGQSSWIPQVLHGKGLFGNNLKKVIEHYYN